MPSDHRKMTLLCRDEECLVCGSVPCEPCHLKHRGMGGANAGWRLEEIVPLCRGCHDKFDARNGASEHATEQTRIVRYVVSVKSRAWHLARR